MIREKNVDSGSVQPALQQANCYVQPGCQLYNEDCVETMQRIETGSVDLMLTDPPYGTTQNDWDNKPFLAKIWAEWERILKPNGIWVFTAAEPFASELVVSRAVFFKYDMIWEKDRASGHLNANKMPLRAHEQILVFYRKPGTYNPQKSFGHKPANKNGQRKKETTNYGKFEHINGGGNTDRMPRSVIYEEVVNSQHEPIHPTQKPLDLMRYLVRTYSNENDLVFDGYSGSGTTAAACIKEKRRFIGAELSKEYFDKSVERLELLRSKPELF